MRRLLHLPVQPTVVSGWQAWDMLADDPDSILVDLGSIGSPDLRELNKVPSRSDARPANHSTPIFLLSQTGTHARKIAAAWLADGYAGVAVISEGATGWQALGLPWTEPTQAEIAQQQDEAGKHEELVDEPVGGPDRPLGRIEK